MGEGLSRRADVDGSGSLSVSEFHSCFRIYVHIYIYIYIYEKGKSVGFSSCSLNEPDSPVELCAQGDGRRTRHVARHSDPLAQVLEAAHQPLQKEKCKVSILRPSVNQCHAQWEAAHQALRKGRYIAKWGF